MTDRVRRLAYFDEWMDTDGHERAAAALPGVEVVRMDSQGPAGAAWQTLSTAHGQQLRPSTETPEEFYPTAAYFARCPNLLAISAAGAGYDMVDVEACTKAGVLLFNQTGSNSESVAQHALAMMLTLSKQLIQSDRAMRSDRRDWTRWDFNGGELTGRTVGIVGLGNIGRRTARLCKGLFDMRVLAYDPFITDADFAERGAERVGDLATLFGQADFISVHTPLTAETQGMIGAELFAAMRPGAIFVNTARGFIHDEVALESALRAGKLAGAGLDVFEQEPPPVDHPLLTFDNVLVSPHNAGITTDANRGMVTSAVEQWVDVFAGRRPRNLQNPKAWDAFARRYQETFGQAAAE
ncbi:MAG: hydroxyacid dehydrogenase [Rhodospirillaceae bacterium]